MDFVVDSFFYILSDSSSQRLFEALPTHKGSQVSTWIFAKLTSQQRCHLHQSPSSIISQEVLTGRSSFLDTIQPQSILVVAFTFLIQSLPHTHTHILHGGDEIHGGPQRLKLRLGWRLGPLSRVESAKSHRSTTSFKTRVVSSVEVLDEKVKPCLACSG